MLMFIWYHRVKTKIGLYHKWIPSQIGKYPVEDVSACFVYGLEEYLHRFMNLEKGKRTFHYGAAFFGPLWFAYRLMWKEALVLLSVLLILFRLARYFIFYVVQVPGAEGTYKLVCSLIMLWAYVFNGLQADKIYWAKVRNYLVGHRVVEKKLRKKDISLKNLDGNGVSIANLGIMLGFIQIILNCNI